MKEMMLANITSFSKCVNIPDTARAEIVHRKYHEHAFKIGHSIMYLSQKACVGGTRVEKLIFNIISVKDEATHVQQWLGVSHLLERHPFSGLVHSVGELLHTP